MSKTYQDSVITRVARPRSRHLQQASGIASGSPSSPGVTSVALTMPTGFDVEGSPITRSGELRVAFSQGYSLLTPEARAILDLFGIDEDGNVYLKKDADNNPRSFYAYGEITAGGPGQGGGEGASYLYQLQDVPDYRTAYRGKYLRAKTDGSGVEWVDVTGGASAFDDLTGRPKYNGSAMTSSTDIPAVPTALSQLSDDTNHRLVTDTEKTTWNGKQNAITSTRKLSANLVSGLATVATSGAYSDLSGTPTIPTQLPNPYSLTFGSKTYDGSSAKEITKSDLGLGNVENKSSATIRGELTASNVTTALGNTAVAKATDADTLDGQHGSYYAAASSLGNYLPLSGGTMTGNLQIGNYASNPKLILQDSTIGSWALQIQNGAMKLGYGNGSLSLTYGGTLSISQAATIAGNTVYHSGNCNNTSTTWSASYLTSSGGLVANYGKAQQLLIESNADVLSETIVGINAYSGGWKALTINGSTLLLNARSHGNVGINTPSPSEKLHVVGNILVTGEITAGSDRRWKDNISPLSSNPIMALLPCEWDWKEGHGNGHSAGFIAQDVRKILPYAVKGDEEQGYTLNYNVFHAFEVKMLQSHETEIDRLRKRVAFFEKQLNINS